MAFAEKRLQIGLMSTTQQEKITMFRALHEAPGAFVIPNPWDAGSARLLASLGFAALATSSSASAGTLGREDHGVSRDEALAMARQIVLATDLPVSADLENGFGRDPEAVRQTSLLAAGLGLAGFSIEDSDGGHAGPYDLTLSTERVESAIEANRRAPTPLVFTARAENFICGNPNLDDTIKRLQAYESAGADVLFAPGLPTLDAIRAVCSSVSKPVNVIGYVQNGALTVEQLAEAGAKRISLATGLYRYAMAGLRDAGQELLQRGSFNFITRALTNAEMHAVLSR